MILPIGNATEKALARRETTIGTLKKQNAELETRVTFARDRKSRGCGMAVR
jgi:hypothetical protein